MSEYKRITDNECSPCIDCLAIGGCRRDCKEKIIYDHLAEFEDKLESGRLIELPCKVGTWVYCIAGCYKWVGLFRRDYFYDIVEYPFDLTMIDNYKIDWFLTKDEAEARLKELQEGKK